MSSPFPGMDPYLENTDLWPDFRRRLVDVLQDVLAPRLADRYLATPCRRRYASGFAPAIAEHDEDYVEVRQRKDGQLITLVDVVSPANKTTHVGREAYLATRGEGRHAGANLVEVDLVVHCSSSDG
jgi:hypothetical protein